MLNQRITDLVTDFHLKPETALTTLSEEPLRKLKAITNEGAENAPERSSLKGDLNTLRSYLEEKHEAKEKPVWASKLALRVLDSPKGEIVPTITLSQHERS
jgi:hypothetical protein